MHMWCAAAVYIARLKPTAVVAYLAVTPPAHVGFYTAMGFVPAGDPQPYPYLETEGVNPQVQPMLLEGRALQNLVVGASRVSVQATPEYSLARFEGSHRLRPLLEPSVDRSSGTAVLVPSAREDFTINAALA
jgi:hypothetical protein